MELVDPELWNDISSAEHKQGVVTRSLSMDQDGSDEWRG